MAVVSLHTRPRCTCVYVLERQATRPAPSPAVLSMHASPTSLLGVNVALLSGCAAFTEPASRRDHERSERDSLSAAKAPVLRGSPRTSGSSLLSADGLFSRRRQQSAFRNRLS